MSKAVCYFGSYDPNYARNKIIKYGLERNGFKVYECQAHGIFTTRYFKLIKLFLKNHGKISAIIVGFPGHLDVPLAFLLGKIFRKKVFFDIFASTYETYVLDRAVIKKNSASAKFFYFIDWLGLHLVDYVIIDTQAHAEFYHKLYGLGLKKQIVVYVGSLDQIFRPRKVKEDTDVLFYGSYQPLQGVETIIKAASKLPNVNFKLIGEGQTKNSCQNLVKELKLKNVDFINWLSIAKLAEEISRAKIILGIFGATKKAFVVIPNKVFDALASKKAVITASTKATNELFDRKSANLINPNDPNKLATTIKLLLTDTNLRNKIAIKGYNIYLNRLKPEKVVMSLIPYLK